MDLEHGSITRKQSDIVFEFNGGSKHLETLKVLDGRDRDGLSTVLPEATAREGDLLVPSRKLIYLSSLSSAESDSSLEDLLQVDTHRISTSARDTSLPRNYDFSSVGPASTSRASDVTHGSMHGISPTESPAVQTMDRCEQYDPYRIPSSVFARSKSNNEMEWSVASNESLFSIHIGNNSFSRDRIFFLSDLGKSGELYKSGELFSLSPPPPVPVVETESNRIEEVTESRVEAVAHDTIKDSARIHPVDHMEEKVPPPTASSKSPCLSRRSDGSGASTHSFAFPILTDGMKNSVKVAHYIHELEGLESPPAAAAAEAKLSPKRVIKPKPTYWFRCFHWCKWGCSCSHRRSCSCSSCSCC